MRVRTSTRTALTALALGMITASVTPRPAATQEVETPIVTARAPPPDETVASELARAEAATDVAALPEAVPDTAAQPETARPTKARSRKAEPQPAADATPPDDAAAAEAVPRPPRVHGRLIPVAAPPPPEATPQDETAKLETAADVATLPEGAPDAKPADGSAAADATTPPPEAPPQDEAPIATAPAPPSDEPAETQTAREAAAADATAPPEAAPEAAPDDAEAADAAAQPSDAVRRVTAWVDASGDNGGLPFVVIDKIAAEVFVFDGEHRLLGAAPALLGLAAGDDSPPGIGERKLKDIGPEDRITPAGRFVAAFGPADHGRRVLWVDYDDAVSLHAVVTSNKKEQRLARLFSPSADDNRITYGCINIPAAFYENLVGPLFAESSGVVYILPDTKPLDEVFPTMQAQAPPSEPPPAL